MTLTLIEKTFLLKKCDLFSELDLDLVLAIADKAVLRELENKEMIFSEGQEAAAFYVIIQGSVVIDEEVTLLPFTYFGDEALFSQTNRKYSAEASGKTKCLTLSRQHLGEIILECPQVALQLLRAYAAITPYRKPANQDAV
ncbi:MAG TPA: cyclic nucleotide-binding domain-containing protein [Chlamydiales bacterium]|nr:cyclic nucleotide-binding domain-containing protein [Chlamydiales bacterium]